MKIRRITATPVNFPLEAPYGWVFGELPGFSQTIVEVETEKRRALSPRACAAPLPKHASRQVDRHATAASGTGTTATGRKQTNCPTRNPEPAQ